MISHADSHAAQVGILAANIRTARKSLGLTQSQLATAIGVEQLAVSRWERAVSVPHPANLAALTINLDRDLAWLYTDHSKKEAA